MAFYFLRSIFGADDAGCARCAAIDTLAAQITTLDAELRAAKHLLVGAFADNRILRARLANAEAGVMVGK
jgi:hypothetical protein